LILLGYGGWPKPFGCRDHPPHLIDDHLLSSFITNLSNGMRRFLGVLSMLIAASLSGCGHGDTIWVKGVLQKGGEVYQPPDGRKLALYFYPMKSETPGNTATEIEMADYDPRDGSFTVPGREGNGITPGKYRIAVIETLRREEFDKVKKTAPKRQRRQEHEKRADKETNFLEAQFGEHTSPFVHELSASATLTLDMAKPTQ
jgi:hypothetical protein